MSAGLDANQSDFFSGGTGISKYRAGQVHEIDLRSDNFGFSRDLFRALNIIDWLASSISIAAVRSKAETDVNQCGILKLNALLLYRIFSLQSSFWRH